MAGGRVSFFGATFTIAPQRNLFSFPKSPKGEPTPVAPRDLALAALVEFMRPLIHAE